MSSIYEQLGIDAHKSSVKEIFKAIIDNEFPTAFVNIITNPFNPTEYLTQHQDGDGSKSVLRWLSFLETGDESVLKGMVDDALSMNTGDVAASGFVFGPWVISDVLNIGKLPYGGKKSIMRTIVAWLIKCFGSRIISKIFNVKQLTDEGKHIIMRAVATRLVELKDLYESHGFKISFLGGETADLPDQVRSYVSDMTITASCSRHGLIKGNVEVGDAIYGFCSDGQATWEDTPNSAMMSNGITLARTMLSKKYNRRYPGLKRSGTFYKGDIEINKPQFLSDGMSIVDGILSPTRQWAILIRKIIEGFRSHNASDSLHGIVMNTGGGATKISNIGEDILYRKSMPTPPPIFVEIHKRTGEEWVDMYVGFNCGIGIDVVTKGDKQSRDILVEISEKYNVELYNLGECFESDGGNKVELVTDYGNFSY